MIAFTRQADGYRGWFPVEQNNGTLRIDLAAGDFVVTIVDPDDDAVTTVAVTQSTQKSGMYYFDVLSGFITTNGIGEYGVVIEINTRTGPSGPPHTVQTMNAVLKVSVQDFDSITSTAVVDAVLDEIINSSNHFTADSVGETLVLLRGLAQQNFIIDMTDHIGLFQSKSRLRIFDSAIATSGANANAVGLEGAIASFTMEAEPEGPSGNPALQLKAIRQYRVT